MPQPKGNCSISVHFLPDDKLVEVSQSGLTLLDIALQNRIELPHSCGGNGTCTTCLVHVHSGLDALSPRDELESEFATDRGFTESERLGCQTQVFGHVKVEYKKD